MKYFLFLMFCIAGADAGDVHEVLGGRSGVGKSYIASQQGCDSMTCSGIHTCTTETKICSNNIVDMVGADDDRQDLFVQNGNMKVKISGTSYPLYNLLESLEKDNVHKAKFYMVFDTNDVRDGTSLSSYKGFVEDTLHCPMTRVLNKFRAGVKDHEANKLASDIIVNENQTSGISLTGVECALKLPQDWRDSLLKGDLVASRNLIKISQCQGLMQRKEEFQAHDLNKGGEGHDNNQCQYWGETGGKWCRGIKLFGGCSDWEPNRGWKTDGECIRKRDEHNRQVDDRNRKLNEWKSTVRTTLDQIDAEYTNADCETVLREAGDKVA